MSWLDEVKWDRDGLVPAIAQEVGTNDVLMFAFMNREALERTAELGEAVYWSRSRGRLWHKGEESGNVQKVRELRLDCDNDVVLLKVEQTSREPGEPAIACHTGRHSCFFQMYRDGAWQAVDPVLKDPESIYSPGRRGMFWFKLKKELATLDVIVVAAELGHGKRNHVLSDYTFAVRDETSGELLTIGKAYSGLTDVEIAELTEHFKKQTIANHGRYREVKPDTVLEIAFDSIQPSTRHASGLALRFPRIKAIRRDKTVDAIDTLEYARSLMKAPAAE